MGLTLVSFLDIELTQPFTVRPEQELYIAGFYVARFIHANPIAHNAKYTG